MKSLSIEVASKAQTQSTAAALTSALAPNDILLLTGDLGAGKTAFCAGLGAGLGIAQAIQSPTFNLVLEYKGRLPFYHFDLYRLDDADELIDIDYYGILESGGVCAVEWAEKFPEALPDEYLHITISYCASDSSNATASDSRLITAEATGVRYEALLDHWSAALER